MRYGSLSIALMAMATSDVFAQAEKSISGDSNEFVKKIVAVQAASFIRGSYVNVKDGTFEIAEVKSQIDEDTIMISYCNQSDEIAIAVNNVEYSESKCGDARPPIPLLSWAYNAGRVGYDVQLSILSEDSSLAAMRKAFTVDCAALPAAVASAANGKSGSGTWYTSTDGAVASLPGDVEKIVVAQHQTSNKSECAFAGDFWLFGQEMDETSPARAVQDYFMNSSPENMIAAKDISKSWQLVLHEAQKSMDLSSAGGITIQQLPQPLRE
ncbi:hypothetical protein [Aurantimonas sp. A3-2-R12]|uniref:hypothetical protein n=1 Tax=Aurantimonas sp. A3-2-R12 TaxID=3114362 RepID=UPI002E18AC7C|nr:hypothetical protein [Aurantimonas sp. A3-2-R12]